MRTLIILVCLLSAAVAVQGAEQASQTVGETRYNTPNYQLVMWSAGHFAVKVGGSWMPGCVCLNIGNVAQYQTDQLSYMESRAKGVEGGRKITVSGRLTPDLAFTQTLVCVAESVTLTYSVQALIDLPNGDIRITAGPQIDQMQGKTLEIETAGGKQQTVWPPAQPISATDVASLVWHNVGMREARTVFVKCAGSQANLSDKAATYVAWLHKGAMKQGETAEATVRFEAIPVGDAAATVANMAGKLGITKFSVAGKNGLLNNVRTDQGLLIQQLSLNEQDMHQVQVGQGRGSEWGGVHVGRQEPGQEYAIEGKGAIINEWREKVDARNVTADRDEIHWSAHRTLDKGEQRLRVLMYVAQWLEQERNPYFIRTPDGKVLTQDSGETLYFGMPPRNDDPGLGRYRKLGTYPAGTEIVVPMLSRAEQMTVRLGQPMEIDGFRFEIYFRGLWFQTLDNKQQDLDLTVTVEKLPQRQVGTLQVADDPLTGAVRLGSGGIPLLDGIVARDDKGQVVKGTWEWKSEANSGQGTLTAKAKTVEMRVPEWLWGKLGTTLDGMWLRLASGGKSLELAGGWPVDIDVTGTERLRISCAGAMTIESVRSDDGAASLVLTPRNEAARVTFRYGKLAGPARDPIASREPSAAPQDDPGVYGGLRVQSDTPMQGDVTVVTPWWQVVHAAASGGVISSIRFANGSGDSILGRLPETEVHVPGYWYADLGTAAKIVVEQAAPDYVRLKVTGMLRGPRLDSLCPIEQVYEYRPMLVRHTVRILLGDKKIDCTGLSIGSLTLKPDLNECAFRHTDDRTTWAHAVFPGPPTVEYKDFSQYLCLFRRGVEGIDWLPAGDLAQWWGVGGRKDGARYAIAGGMGGDPKMIIEPIAMSSQPVQLTGTITFESYLSLPQTRRCLQRRSFVACLGNGECTPEMLKQCADYGVTDIMLGAGNNPGSFELTDLKASQKTVQAAAQYGMKVYPFDPFQLVNRRAPLWQQHDLMARMDLKNGKPVPAVFSDYGDYFCPSCKEFRDALKAGYKKLVESADSGGLYHDFTHPYTCYNQKHWTAAGPAEARPLQAAAIPEAQGHINTDGVLDMILWDRNFLGKDRVFCGHTGWVPVLFFQDLCTVTAIFEEYPSTEPLPLYLTPAQGEFVNAAQRTLVSSFLSTGAGAPGEENPCPPKELVDAYLSRCALVGIFPWMNSGNMGATDAFDLLEKSRPWYRLFALRGKNDLGTMQFLPWHRQTAVLSSNPFVRAATYWNADKAIIVVANSEAAAAQDFSFTVLPEQFGWAKTATVTLTPMKDCGALKAAGPNAFSGTLPGFGWSAYQVTRR